jgi:hypothetical protein
MKTTAVKFCALLAATFTTSAFASVTVNSGDRSVILNNAPSAVTSQSSNTTSGPYIDNVADSGGSDTTATSGTADQNTDIQALIFGGSGSAHVTGHTGSPNNLAGRSRYSITITTDTYYDWFITGSLSINLDGGSGISYVALDDNNTFSSVFFQQKTGGFGSDAVNSSGLLAPGFYTFEIFAQANGTNGGNAFATAGFENLTLTLRPSEVPEPASLSILAIGAGALMMRRRKS